MHRLQSCRVSYDPPKKYQPLAKTGAPGSKSNIPVSYDQRGGVGEEAENGVTSCKSSHRVSYDQRRRDDHLTGDQLDWLFLRFSSLVSDMKHEHRRSQPWRTTSRTGTEQSSNSGRPADLAFSGELPGIREACTGMVVLYLAEKHIGILVEVETNMSGALIGGILQAHPPGERRGR